MDGNLYGSSNDTLWTLTQSTRMARLAIFFFLKSSVEWNGKVVFEFWKIRPDEERFCLELPLTSYFYFLKGKNE